MLSEPWSWVSVRRLSPRVGVPFSNFFSTRRGRLFLIYAEAPHRLVAALNWQAVNVPIPIQRNQTWWLLAQPQHEVGERVK